SRSGPYVAPAKIAARMPMTPRAATPDDTVSECVFPGANGSKGLHCTGRHAAAVTGRCAAHMGIFAAQTGIGTLFQGQGSGQGNATVPAQVLDHFEAHLYIQIVRLDRTGELQVGLGIFMGAIYGGVIRQRGQLLQRGIHLLGRPLEQSAAAASEQGVAAEQPGVTWVIAEVGNMVQGMAGHRQHLDLLFEQAYLEAIFERPVDTLDGVVGRPPDLAAGRGLEGQYPAGMVRVIDRKSTRLNSSHVKISYA